MVQIKRSFLFLFALLWVACSSDENNPNRELTTAEENFIEEYHYITFNLSPTSFGGQVNEKWRGEVNLFLDGEYTDSYEADVEIELNRINSLMTDGTSISLTQSFSAANIHLLVGQESDVASLWPDMYEFIKNGNFSGYALYNSEGFGNIIRGRIWVKNLGMPIFTHELGHIIGLGHASEPFCSAGAGERRSFMCSSLAESYSVNDLAVIQTLYHPSIAQGVEFEEIRPVVERLIVNGEIRVE